MIAQELLGVLAALGQRLVAVVEDEPRFSTTPSSTAMSSRSPALEMPSLYMMSNSATRNGGATLFFFTLTRVAVADHFAAAP